MATCIVKQYLLPRVDVNCYRVTFIFIKQQLSCNTNSALFNNITRCCIPNWFEVIVKHKLYINNINHIWSSETKTITITCIQYKFIVLKSLFTEPAAINYIVNQRPIDEEQTEGDEEQPETVSNSVLSNASDGKYMDIYISTLVSMYSCLVYDYNIPSLLQRVNLIDIHMRLHTH